jgi:hypothetical protein
MPGQPGSPFKFSGGGLGQATIFLFGGNEHPPSVRAGEGGVPVTSFRFAMYACHRRKQYW